MKEDTDLKRDVTEIIEPSDLGSLAKTPATASDADNKPVTDPVTEQIVTIDHGHGIAWGVIIVLVVLILGVSSYLLLGTNTNEKPADTTTNQQSNDDLSQTLEAEATTIEQEINQLSESDFEDATLADPALNN